MSFTDPSAPPQTPPAPAPTPPPVLEPEPEPEAKDTYFSQTGEPLEEHPYYCPGCGLRYDYPQKCTGKAESGHQPIEVVSTDELQGDEHTAAPKTTS